MKNKSKVTLFLVMGGMMSVVLVQPTEAGAWQRAKRHSYRNHGYYHHGHPANYPRGNSGFVLSFPAEFIRISLGGKTYHYHKGAYYLKDRHIYNVVSAPIGACITRLPHGYQKIYVDGVPYYTYNDVHYKHTRNGYEVINKPYSVHAKNTQVGSEHQNIGMENSITLSVRNKEGGLVSITVRPSGNGYVGPQGEYYDEFPKIEHLKLIYGS